MTNQARLDKNCLGEAEFDGTYRFCKCKLALWWLKKKKKKKKKEAAS